MLSDLEIQRSTYPRVSEIIQKQNEHELRAIPIEKLVNAAVRGTAVHQYCTSYMMNLWIDDVKPEYNPYFDAFKKWAKENVKKTLHTSTRLYDDVRRFTGEFDMIVKLKDGKNCLLDIKTSSSKSKTWPVQLAAYRHLCQINGYTFDEVVNLHLKATETAKFDTNEQGEKVLVSPPVVKCRVIKHEDINASWEIFSSALRCYDYFDRKESK